jgi:hypothetical protein
MIMMARPNFMILNVYNKPGLQTGYRVPAAIYLTGGASFRKQPTRRRNLAHGSRRGYHTKML